MQALKAAGIETVTADYSGAGDEGNGYEVSYFPENLETPSPVSLKLLASHWNEHSQWEQIEIEKSFPITEAIEEFADQLLSLNRHDEYFDGEGGGGSLNLDVARDTYSLNHYDNVVEQITSIHEG